MPAESESKSESKSKSESESKDAKGVELDLGMVAKAERNRQESSHEQVERLLEGEVLVVFELPDGSEGEQRFKMGHTVLLLKTFVEDEYDIPLNDQRLIFNGTTMLDPLSLSDFPTIQPRDVVVIRVDGPLPRTAASKK